MDSHPIKLLFVCMGNICRSPAAEAVMQRKVDEDGKSSLIFCDSAGTIDYHTGQPSDHRMRNAAAQRCYHMTSRARQIKRSDLSDFDYILTMDEENLDYVLSLDPDGRFHHKIRPFCDYLQQFEASEIPDPYYGGLDGFDHVLDLLEDGCNHLLTEVTPA